MKNNIQSWIFCNIRNIGSIVAKIKTLLYCSSLIKLWHSRCYQGEIINFFLPVLLTVLLAHEQFYC